LKDRTHHNSLENIFLNASWATIGSFDGVHQGHQEIIKQIVSEARDARVHSVVVTFFPHPAVVLRGIKNSFYLTSPDERADLLSAMGIDHVITIPFSKQLASQSAYTFMAEIVKHLGVKKVWVGDDFTLGKDKEGDISALQTIGETLGFQMKIFTQINFDGEKISSSQIRSLIKTGAVEKVAILLNRLYSLRGKVIKGDQRGRELGFPTANLDIDKCRLLPAVGVYTTWVILDNQRLPAITNIGLRPTFENSPLSPRVETHILDFDRNIYGADIQLEFINFIRPEQRFASVDQLITQIHVDSQKAREVFNHEI
jgi:riboflavin kinase / FMN adenylyltransferase